MEDMINGYSEWRNIQPVVRRTFKEMHDVIKNQGEKIKVLEKKLEYTASSKTVQSLEVSSANKPTFLEVEKLLAAVTHRLNKSLYDQNHKLSLKADKTNFDEMYDHVKTLSFTTKEVEAIKVLMNEQQNEIKHLKGELKDALRKTLAEEKSDLNESLRKEANRLKAYADMGIKDLRLHMEEKLDKIQQKIDNLPTKEMLDELLGTKVEKTELDKVIAARPTLSEMKDSLMEEVEIREKHLNLNSRLQEIMIQLEKKADQAYVESKICTKVDQSDFQRLMILKANVKEVEQKISEDHVNFADEVLETISTMQKELVAILNKKAFLSEVERITEKKVDKSHVESLLLQKADKNMVFDALAEKVDYSNIEKLIQIQKNKMQQAHPVTEDPSYSGPAILEQYDKLNVRVKNLENKITEKPDFAEVQKLLKQKISEIDIQARISEKNAGLNLLYQEEKTNSSINRLPDLSHMMAILKSEFSLGRWIWNSSQTSSESSVPWNFECVNTSRSNFIWSKDKSEIMLVIPGLYELQLAFFCEHDPTVQILINGEPVYLSTGKTNMLKGSKLPQKMSRFEGLTRRGKHSAGRVTAWSMTDFLSLPNHAKVSVLYEGDEGVQGFLGIKKL